MKNLGLFFMIFLPVFCFGQVNESFLDGNFINNPIWTGTSSNFIVNSALQLQSQATATSTSFLFTPSEAINNAVWECWVKINYSTSSSNYASIYLASDKADISTGCNGYYVQIGGTNDEVSLFVQEGTKKTKIIDGIDKRTDGSTVELRIRVTRDAAGNFALYSKLAPESSFVLEGTIQDNVIKTSNYFGVLFANTTTTGSCYYFDDITVSGDKFADKDAPKWTTFTLEQPNKLKLGFSEAMDFSLATFIVDNNQGGPVSQTVSSDKTTIEFTFASNFERGKLYKLQLSGLTDLAGNKLEEASRTIGIIEPKVVGDLILNEVMFENPVSSLEYVELYNTSDKLLDVSGLVFTTRKTDGTLNSGCKVPSKTLMLPHAYLALCADADSVRNYHHCLAESNILTTSTWSPLNNEGSTLVLASSAKDTIYDELTYSTKWHNKWVTSPKGISLERNSPNLPTQSQFSWHSSVSADTNYGTPGFKNSEYVDSEVPTWTSFTLEQPNKLKLSFSEPMDFSKAAFTVDNEIGNPTSQLVSADKMSVILSFSTEFTRGKNYSLQAFGLSDLAGNLLLDNTRSIGIIESKIPEDLIINEIMFDNPLNSLEYIEIYNRSDKVLDLSGVTLTTRKTDGSLNTGVKIPVNTCLLPDTYLALCENADSVRNYYGLTRAANILSTEWSSLNNDNATIALTNAAKDTIYDEVSYNVKWHHVLVKNTKGVSLERINPNLPSQSPSSWHSAASEVNSGTPGYQNSQYRTLTEVSTAEKFVWAEPEAFSPDNDGVDDICMVHYKTESNGFVANAIVFNAIGEKVFQLATNQLLATEGMFSWDGRTDKGKNINVGVYVLYFEMFNPQTGVRKQSKLPIVVSSR
jgi:hypothetical protein